MAQTSSRVATPHSTKEGRGLVTFTVAACYTEISFTLIVLALRPHNYLRRLTKQLLVVLQLIYTLQFPIEVVITALMCTVIGPALHSAGQQTAVTEVTRPLLDSLSCGTGCGHARLGTDMHVCKKHKHEEVNKVKFYFRLQPCSQAHTAFCHVQYKFFVCM